MWVNTQSYDTIIKQKRIRSVGYIKMSATILYWFLIAIYIDRKLHHLTRPMHSGVSAPAKRPTDVEAEVGGQRPVDAEAGGLRSGG